MPQIVFHTVTIVAVFYCTYYISPLYSYMIYFIEHKSCAQSIYSNRLVYQHKQVAMVAMRRKWHVKVNVTKTIVLKLFTLGINTGCSYVIVVRLAGRLMTLICILKL